MRLLTWNEKNEPDLPTYQVIFDTILMGKNFNSGATIIGTQEIGEDLDLNAIQNAFKGFATIGPKPIPLFINTKYFRVIRHGYTKTHDGKAGISPHRGYTWVLIKRKFRPFIKPFYVINTHYVSGAFTPGVREPEWRRQMWNIHHKSLKTFVNGLNANGHDVYLVGDMNRRYYPASAFGDKALTMGSHGYDHILVCPAKRLPAKISSYIFRDYMYTDHKPVVAEFTLVRN